LKTNIPQKISLSISEFLSNEWEPLLPLLHHLDVKRLIASLVTKGLKKQTIHNILTPFKEGYHHAIDDGVVPSILS
jgi:hypothetical protein